ncbi:MAG TPA: rhodanese-like domain-containing protein [Candidatus Dorea intestinavium]|nr:rhodanese-like domain-containing protein [Candidatus Dorea intestinavium]
MKRKIVLLGATILLAGTLAMGCGSKEEAKTEDTKTEESAKTDDAKEESEWQYVSADEALKAAKAGETHILDVREWDNYVEGRLINSQWCPIFPLEDESLVEKMTTYAKDKLMDGKEIYIVCNSGQRGAQKATGVLEDAGIDKDLIYTVEGGAKALAKMKNALTTSRVDENIDWQYAEAKDVIADKDAQIIDVRDDENFEAGHLAGSLHSDLTDVEDVKLQKSLVEMSNDLDPAKPVYFMCYSGNKCAKTGVSLLQDAGFKADQLFIIKDGAKGADAKAAFEK